MDQFAAQQQQGSPSVTSQSATPTNNAAAGDNASLSANTTAASAGPAFQPDENSKTLYVGNLDQTVNEAYLQEIFSQAGGVVESVKIIRDNKYAHQGGLNYGFVEFSDHAAAEIALQTMNGRRVCLQELKVNWAFTGQVAGKEDTTTHYHIFIGDLSPEINDEMLSNTFSVFGSMTDARVMWDPNSGKSRGYGFAAFKDRLDAERAIMSMNGQVLGNRAIRCNWASQRGVPGPTFHQSGGHHHGNSFKSVSSQAAPFNTTVYVGNLPPHTTQEDLIPFFQPFGMVVDIRLQVDRGFAFVKLDSHDKAANAIVRLSGTMINGRPAKLSWGKDRSVENATRGNHYGYYNNNAGYSMGGGHQNNSGYPYQYNNHNNHHNNHYGGGGQGYGRNGPHNHHHHHNQHHQHHNGHHINSHHNQQHAFHHQQQVGLDGAGSSALAAGSSGLPPANMAVGSSGGNNGGMSQDAYDQFTSYDNNGGSR
ncbi:hypothetical protein BX616_005446 [Lobosporangium transversale]|uniref:RRM domain-containing protein n=1 Tax=Lobosporangium transversale TaxID=64571 RepID=A0A1Y2H5F2_9FUNG|nr:hypothetical protein BCR41DRAFT_316840 [Lobosporangium transversale]KAF9897531.1 hypothetical protein BX616_005446 [Lobosporangium transversale]ORZ28272.1 hypothetical protein BCR41DRAFT_316840 [Lobosporangium transversale]|eukprot:XP_021885957.1 hypothetical protein BCR41DRAFT_316840 [Lobosporangium transversale]